MNPYPVFYPVLFPTPLLPSTLFKMINRMRQYHLQPCEGLQKMETAKKRCYDMGLVQEKVPLEQSFLNSTKQKVTWMYLESIYWKLPKPRQPDALSCTKIPFLKNISGINSKEGKKGWMVLRHLKMLSVANLHKRKLGTSSSYLSSILTKNILPFTPFIPNTVLYSNTVLSFTSSIIPTFKD